MRLLNFEQNKNSKIYKNIMQKEKKYDILNVEQSNSMIY